MKRLTCEMCGSTDLIKENGVFVCQSCGCKYSIEEAKKMMVEGTVEVAGKVNVQGTVKIDRKDESQNFYELSQNAIKNNNIKQAIEYIDQAIEIDARNYKYWFIKMKAFLLNNNIEKSFELGENVITFSPEEKKDNIYIEVYGLIIKTIISIIKKTTYDIENSSIAVSFHENYTRDNYNIIAEEASNNIFKISNDIIAKSPVLLKLLNEFLEQNQHGIEVLIQKGGTADNGLRNRKDRQKLFLEKVKKAKELSKNSYKDSYEKEMDKLLNEKNEINQQIKELTNKKYNILERIPETYTCRELELRIRELEKEINKAGFFGGKKVKAFKQETEQIKSKIAELKKIQEQATLELDQLINQKIKRLETINKEINYLI